jgi:uncharacterized protein (UPF0332 family)
MKTEVKELIEKAKRSQKSAELMFKEKEFDFAGSRAYYTMFYVAQALLLERDLAFSSHSGVIANFGKEFAKTGLLNSNLHQYLIKAQGRRNIGDYGIGDHLNEEEVREMLAWGAEFIKVAEKYLRQAF